MRKPKRLWLYEHRWWWTAINPDETLALMDCHTRVRSRTRESAIAKAKRRFWSAPTPREEVFVTAPVQEDEAA